MPLAVRRDRSIKACANIFPRHHKSIVVGLSGGADSCALIAILSVLRDRGWPLDIHAVHVCHNLRDGCHLDAEISESLARIAGCSFERVDIYPNPSDGNLYDQCRRLRYDALTRCAENKNATAVAVAHHLNDQLETIIFRLSRGSVVESLMGMEVERNLSEKISLVRPLLKITREDCERICNKMNFKWVEDPSNYNTNKTRAFIRHKIVPLFRHLNPRIELSIGRVAENLKQYSKGPNGK